MYTDTLKHKHARTHACTHACKQRMHTHTHKLAYITYFTVFVIVMLCYDDNYAEFTGLPL